VKRTRASDREAERHVALRRLGVDVPDLLCVVEREHDIIVVHQQLDDVAVDLDDRNEVDEFLEAVARWNATDASGNDVFTLGPGTPSDEFDRLIQDALERLEPLTGVDVDPVQWLRSFRAASSRVASIPTALTHGELFVQQVGWKPTPDGRVAVPLDLATFGLRPRLSDITILSTFADLTGRDEQELLTVYLAALAKAGGPTIPLDAADTEVRMLRVVDTVASLPWRVAAVDDPLLGRDGLVLATQRLRDDLARLDL
jgi:hypothetical protein